MRDYDLLNEKWLTCALLDGRYERMAILDLLRRASDIREIAEPSPLVTFGTHRFLLAVIHWLDPVAAWTDWKNRWEAGHFPEKMLKDLRERGGERFHLFHTETPFYQHAELAGDEKPVSYLSPRTPTGTSINHFCHAYDEGHAFCPSCCAKGLLQLPPFCSAGGQGLSPSVNGTPPLYVLPLGMNLFQTLMLNLPVSSLLPEWAALCPADDTPAWERGTVSRDSVGMLEGFTWQPRQVRLIVDHEDTGRCTNCGMDSDMLTRRMVFVAGRSPRENAERRWTDPHVSVRRDMMVLPSPRADFWRTELAAVLGEVEQDGVRQPIVIKQVRACMQRGAPSRRALDVATFSFRVNKAAPVNETRRRFSVPSSALLIEDTGTLIREELRRTTSVAEHLNKATRGQSKRAPVLLGFEAEMCGAFHDLLGRLSADANAQSLLRDEWNGWLRGAAMAAFDATARPRRHSGFLDRSYFEKRLDAILLKGDEQ